MVRDWIDSRLSGMLLVYLTAVMAFAGCGDDDASGPTTGILTGTATLEGVGVIDGIAVEIDGTQRSIETDEEGKFTFANVAPGTLTLVASYPEYVETTVEVEITARETTEATIELDQVNLAPSIDEVEIDPPVLVPEGESTATVIASDPNPDTLTYEFEATNGYSVVGTDANTATIKAPADFDVEGQLIVIVSDEDGATDRQVVDLITVDNDAPVLEGIIAIPSELQPGQSATVTAHASDADGDELSYQWEVPADWTIDAPTSEQVQITAPNAYGETAVITVTVTDAYDVAARGSITLTTAENRAPSITSITATPPQTTPAGEITLAASASDPEEGAAVSYQWTAPADWMIADETAATTTITAPDSYGVSGTVTLTVTDSEGAEATSNIVVSTVQNNGPIISSVTATPQSVMRGGTIDLSVSASDPNGDALTYQWSAPTGWLLDDATARQPVLSAPAQSGETATIEVVVTDRDGLSSNGQVVVSTTVNSAPTLSALNANPPQTQPQGTIALQTNATDADGDQLTYTWTAPTDWTLNGSGASVSVTAPDAYNSVGVVQLLIEDGFGGSVSGQITVSTVQNQDPVIQSFTATNNPIRRGESTQLRVSATDPNGDAIVYSWEKADDPNDNWTITPDATDPTLATLTAPNMADEAVTIRVVVTDAYGAASRTDLRVSTKSNEAPIVASLVANQNPLDPQATTTVSTSASDPNPGDTLSYNWSVDDASWTIVPDASNPSTAQITAPDSYDVSTTVTVVVTDDLGASTTSTLRVSTRQNQAPVISSVSAQQNPLDRNGATTVNVMASDANGDSLSYAYSVSGTGWTITPDASNPQQATLQAPDAYGASATVTVEVTDAYGLSTMSNLQVSTLSNSTPVIQSFSAASNPLERGESTVLTVSASDPNGDALTYTFTLPNSSTWSIDSATPADANKVTLTAPDTAGASTTVTVEVSDDTGEVATAELPISVFGNRNPTVSSIAAASNPVGRAGSTTISVSADDANPNDTLSYAWSLNNPNWTITAGAGTSSITVQAPDVPSDSLVATVVVSDDAGGQTTANLQVSTEVNDKPDIISSPPSDEGLIANNRSIWTYQMQATDADDTNLTWTLDAGTTSATIDSATGEITWEPTRSEDGTYTFTVTVSDGYDTDSQIFDLTPQPFELAWTEWKPAAVSRFSSQWVGDLDGDGLLDTLGNPNQWAEANNIHLSFRLSSENYASDYTVNSSTTNFRWVNCYSFLSGDFDADGNEDFVVSCLSRRDIVGGATEFGPWITRFEHDPNAASNSGLIVHQPGYWRSPANDNSVPMQSTTADVDADGNLDLVVVTNSRQVHTFLGDGNGGFSAIGATSILANGNVRDMLVTNMDADSQPEMVTAQDVNNGVYVYDFQANGLLNATAKSTMSRATAGVNRSLMAEDLDADGDQDVVHALRSNPDTLVILSNDGSAGLTEGTELGMSTPNCFSVNQPRRDAVAIGDYDADGLLDVAVATISNLNCSFQGVIAFGDGAGGFSEGTLLTDSAHRTSSWNWFMNVDWNGDGIDDLMLIDANHRMIVGY